MGRAVDNSGSFYYGENVDFVKRIWKDYVQDIDTNTFGESEIHVTFKGTGIIKITGKDFEKKTILLQSIGEFKEILAFRCKLPPKTTVQARAPKNKRKIIIKKIRICPSK